MSVSAKKNPKQILNKKAWKTYRNVKRQLLSMIALEEHLGAELYNYKKLIKANEVSTINIIFVIESLKSLKDTAEDLVYNISSLQESLNQKVLTSNQFLKKTFRCNFPEIDEKHLKDLEAIVNAYGNFRNWFLSFESIVSIKLHTYALCIHAMKKDLDGKDSQSIKYINQIFKMSNLLQPQTKQIYKVERYDFDAVKEDYSKKIISAKERRKADLISGDPCFIANGESKAISNELCVKYPTVAKELGVDCCEIFTAIPIPCISNWIAAGFCLVSLLLRFSNHNYEDPEPGGGTGGGGTGGGGTGGGGTGGGGTGGDDSNDGDEDDDPS